jgi:hypothetical protein
VKSPRHIGSHWEKKDIVVTVDVAYDEDIIKETKISKCYGLLKRKVRS